MFEILKPSLKERTTLRLGGHAIAELRLEKREDLDKLPEKLRELDGEPFFIGRGSNILAKDGALPIILVKIAFKEEIKVMGEENGKILVHASADTPIARLLKFCIKNELSGLEGLTGIPGCVGGAVAMNAGSFGVETGQCLNAVEAYVDCHIKTYKINQILPEYRCMRFAGEKNFPLILGAIFALTKGSKSVIFRAMNHNFLMKKSRQPLNSWSAGSTFKNPGEGLFAGRLLEDAGFKGRKLGGMAFSHRHANFLINEGKGESSAALDLMEEARETVKKVSGITLEPEIRIIPCH